MKETFGKKNGFTLVEMLVVIGIIGLLVGALTGSFTYVQRLAWKSQEVKQVSEAATALSLYLQQERGWGALKNKEEIDLPVLLILKNHRLFDTTATADSTTTVSPDRYGLLDIWGQRKLKANPDIGESLVSPHRLQFLLDDDYDGFVKSPSGKKIRASALVWSRGPDGVDDTPAGRYPKDDILSWSEAGAR